MKRDHWYPKGTLEKPFVPQDISKAKQVFPANVADLMPPVEDIPDDFGDDRHSKWHKLFGALFFGSVKNLSFARREGIDAERAWTHIQTIMRSFEPKHEYKEAACTYLMSIWFDDVTWETA